MFMDIYMYKYTLHASGDDAAVAVVADPYRFVHIYVHIYMYMYVYVCIYQMYIYL